MADRMERIVDYQVTLITGGVSQTGFGLMALLIDDDQIPVDVRFKTYNSTSKDNLDSSSTIFKWASTFFGQDLVPDRFMGIRWVSSETAPWFEWGTGYEKDFEVWKAISDGEFRVVDSTAATDDLTGVDFSAITDFDQVLDVLTTEIQGIGAPNITNLNLAIFEVDALGRILLKMPEQAGSQGDSAPTISIIPVPAGVGTDVSSLMDATNGTSQAGLDAETPTESLIAASKKTNGNEWYIVRCYGATQTDEEELSTYIQSKPKQLDIVSNDLNSKDPSDTTSIGYNLSQLSHKRTMVIYTEKTDEFPDAAFEGRMITTTEGAVNGAGKILRNVTTSGADNGLDDDDKDALKAIDVNWLEDIDGVYLYQAITSGYIERRIITGLDWFEARNQERSFTIWRTQDLITYVDDDLALFEQALRDIAGEAIRRSIFLDTEKYPFTISFPKADDIPEADRTAHELNLIDVFSGWAASAINKIKVTGGITVF